MGDALVHDAGSFPSFPDPAAASACRGDEQASANTPRVITESFDMIMIGNNHARTAIVVARGSTSIDRNIRGKLTLRALRCALEVWNV
jgi:hypothetical protein